MSNRPPLLALQGKVRALWDTTVLLSSVREVFLGLQGVPIEDLRVANLHENTDVIAQSLTEPVWLMPSSISRPLQNIANPVASFLNFHPSSLLSSTSLESSFASGSLTRTVTGLQCFGECYTPMVQR
jgi:hypothetical protein